MINLGVVCSLDQPLVRPDVAEALVLVFVDHLLSRDLQHIPHHVGVNVLGDVVCVPPATGAEV